MAGRSRYGIFALAALAVLCADAGAAEPQNRVQLQVFQVKVVDPSGRAGHVPVTVYIDTPNRRGSTDVCALSPRLRDALLSHLRKGTYKIDARGNLLDTPSIAAGARPIVEGAVKKENVTGVEVRQGAPDVKPSAASMFARSGCIGVAEAMEDAKGGAKAKK